MKKRILSAIVMLIIVIPVIWLGDEVFRIGVGIISLLALKEILDLKKSHKPYPYFVQFIAMVSLLLLVLTEYDGYSILYGITYRGIAILLLLFRPKRKSKKAKQSVKGTQLNQSNNNKQFLTFDESDNF